MDLFVPRGRPPHVLDEHGLDLVLSICEPSQGIPHQVIELGLVENNSLGVNIHPAATVFSRNSFFSDELGRGNNAEYRALYSFGGSSKSVEIGDPVRYFVGHIKCAAGPVAKNACVLAEILDIVVWMLVRPDAVVVLSESLYVRKQKETEASGAVLGLLALFSVSQEMLRGGHRNRDQDCDDAANCLDPCGCILSETDAASEPKHKKCHGKTDVREQHVDKHSLPSDFLPCGHSIGPLVVVEILPPRWAA